MIHAALISMGISAAETGVHFGDVILAVYIENINVNLAAVAAFLPKTGNQVAELSIFSITTLSYIIITTFSS